jgi:hypothetical protein
MLGRAREECSRQLRVPSVELSRLQWSIFRRMHLRHETNISAELEKEEKHTRVPSENEIKNWSASAESKARKRTARTNGQ